MDFRKKAKEQGLSYTWVLGQLEGLTKELNQNHQELNYIVEKCEKIKAFFEELVGK